jgi:hypothetical protein
MAGDRPLTAAELAELDRLAKAATGRAGLGDATRRRSCRREGEADVSELPSIDRLRELRETIKRTGFVYLDARFPALKAELLSLLDCAIAIRSGPRVPSAAELAKTASTARPGSATGREEIERATEALAESAVEWSRLQLAYDMNDGRRERAHELSENCRAALEGLRKGQ